MKELLTTLTRYKLTSGAVYWGLTETTHYDVETGEYTIRPLMPAIVDDGRYIYQHGGVMVSFGRAHVVSRTTKNVEIRWDEHPGGKN